MLSVFIKGDLYNFLVLSSALYRLFCKYVFAIYILKKVHTNRNSFLPQKTLLLKRLNLWLLYICIIVCPASCRLVWHITIDLAQLLCCCCCCCCWWQWGRACVSWPIGRKWVFRRRGALKGTGAKTECFRLERNTLLLHGTLWENWCVFFSTDTCKPVLVVPKNKITDLKISLKSLL